MRTRLLVVIAAASMALNLAMGTALWSVWRVGHAAGTGMPAAYADASSEEERQVREQLAAELCHRAPNRAAIETTLARLDAVRTAKRREVLDRWLSHSAGVSDSEREQLRHNVTRLLCPWHDGSSEDRCAPSCAPGTPSNNHRAQPDKTRRAE